MDKVIDAFFLPFVSGELNRTLPRVTTRIHAEQKDLIEPMLEQELPPVIERFGNIPRSIQARFLVPMAVSLAFGVLFAPVVTLLVVSSGLYHPRRYTAIF